MKLTVPIVIPGAGAGDMLKANNLGDVLSPATARNNLRVLERDDSWAAAISRVPRSGIWFSGATFPLNGYGAGLALGTSDFTVVFSLAAVDWTTAVAPALVGTHSAGNNRFRLFLTTTGNLQLSFVDGAGADATYNLPLDVPLVDGELYNIAVTCSRGLLATAYINAESDRDFSTASVTVNIAASASVDIGSGNTNPFYYASAFNGVMLNARVFNRALTAAQVKTLLKTGVVDYSDQGASTAKYQSNFSAGVDGFAMVGTGAVTGNTDGIGGENDVLLVDTGAGTTAVAGRAWAVGSGKRLRVKARVFRPASNVTGTHFNIRGVAGSSSIGHTHVAIPGDTWTSIETEILIPSTVGATTVVGLCAVTSAGSITITNGDKIYFKDVSFETIGCIQDLDCGVGIGTHIPDRTTAYPGLLASTSSSAHTFPKINNDIIIRRTLDHSDISSTAGTTKLLDLPPNCGIENVEFDREVAFDGGVTLDIGVVGTQGKYVSGQNVAATGKALAPSLSMVSESSSAFTSVYIKKSGATTQGKTTVRVTVVVRAL